MNRTSSGNFERLSEVARWIAILVGVVVLLALPAVFVMASTGPGELDALNIVPATGLLIFEILIWRKPVVLSAASPAPAASILFCLGAIVSRFPPAAASATDLVVDSYLDIVLVLVIKAMVAAGTWVLQVSRCR